MSFGLVTMLQRAPFHRSTKVLKPLLLLVRPTAHACVLDVASTSRSSPPPGGSGLVEMVHRLPSQRSMTGRSWHAQRAKEVGRNPRIVAYESSFGPSASYYAWEAAGRPVHGIRGRAS